METLHNPYRNVRVGSRAAADTPSVVGRLSTVNQTKPDREPNRFVADIDASLEQQVFVAGLFFRGAIASVPPRAGRG